MILLAEVENDPEITKKLSVPRRQLADRLNRLNFLEEPVLIQFIHRKFGQARLVEASPQPCDGDSMASSWLGVLPENIDQYEVVKVILPGSPLGFLFVPENCSVTTDGFCCNLPTKGTELPKRQFSRLRPLDGIQASISQYGVCFEGTLSDFSARSLCVDVPVTMANSRYWISAGQKVHLTLRSQSVVVFSGEMTVLRIGDAVDSLLFVLAPLNNNTPRFPIKGHRAFRACLLPEPSLAFRHPLTGRQFELNVVDISGLGVCVEEAPERSMLLSGMILPEFNIKLGSGFNIPCRGQVVYRIEPEDAQRGARCGISLLDIEIQDHLRLLSILQRARNRQSYLNPQVDIESLWEFFFETGFIYPSKYMQLASRKEGFQETFRKTYLEQTPIARHFTFQSEGQILAHISAVRLYEQTWFQQHHAARRIGKHSIGFEVILQISEYFYNASFLSRDKIGFIAGIYRPENRFPSKYYRSIVTHLKNPRAASLDSFAYFNGVPEFDDQWKWAKVPPDWKITRTSGGDLDELGGFYRQYSGGCMVEALDLQPSMLGREVLEKEYRKLGMKRRRYLFSVKRENELMAVVEMHEADTGLSLSRTDQAIFCFVLDDELPPGLLMALVRGLSGKLHLDSPPMMIFPRRYAEKSGLGIDKTYEMMVLNVQHMEEYMQFLDSFISIHRLAR